jgi:hypothetical protein
MICATLFLIRVILRTLLYELYFLTSIGSFRRIHLYGKRLQASSSVCSSSVITFLIIPHYAFLCLQTLALRTLSLSVAVQPAVSWHT